MVDTSPQSNKGIFTSEELIIHQMSQTKEEQFANNVSYSGSLKIHQINNEGDTQFSCIQCNKDFLDLGDIKRHMFSHNGGKQFVSTQFFRPDTLVTHMGGVKKKNIFLSTFCG